jgi:DNA processing protein
VGERSEGVQLTDEQRIDWLRLIRSPNVGPCTFRALINHFGGARAALQALPSLARRGGASGAVQICSRDDAQREIAAAQKLGIALVASGEAGYPMRLQMIDDAPPLIAIRGHARALSLPMVAVVGSRNASGAGLKFTQRIARELGEAGFAVVSGLARGIDAAAHAASLATGTIAVLAGGQDRVYPPEHAALLDDILTAGAAVSEMPLGWEPRARDFPPPQSIDLRALARRRHRRSRQTFGLADHGAACARARPRGVRCSGLPLDPRAEGTNGLIKQGATPVTETADVVSVLQPIMEEKTLPAREPEPPGESLADDGEPLPNERERIVALLGPTPVQIDDLVRLSKSSPTVVRMVLLELEIAGRLERHGGGLMSLL